MIHHSNSILNVHPTIIAISTSCFQELLDAARCKTSQSIYGCLSGLVCFWNLHPLFVPFSRICQKCPPKISVIVTEVSSWDVFFLIFHWWKSGGTDCYCHSDVVASLEPLEKFSREVLREVFQTGDPSIEKWFKFWKHWLWAWHLMLG